MTHTPHRGRAFGRAQNYIVAGVLTVVPLWVTWLVFEFFLQQLSQLGRPWVLAISRAIERPAPQVSEWLLHPWFQSILAVLLTLTALYLLGWLATRVVGLRLLNTLDLLIDHIPLVKKVYGGTKKLLGALQTPTAGVQRVVLIAFPTPEMKTVGLVTRVITDHATGRKLAVVYVPTTPNPTSGYVEIIPLDQVVPTDWSMDEAMTFIISGGAVSPEGVHFERHGRWADETDSDRVGSAEI